MLYPIFTRFFFSVTAKFPNQIFVSQALQKLMKVLTKFFHRYKEFGQSFHQFVARLDAVLVITIVATSFIETWNTWFFFLFSLNWFYLCYINCFSFFLCVAIKLYNCFQFRWSDNFQDKSWVKISITLVKGRAFFTFTPYCNLIIKYFKCNYKDCIS